MRPYLKVVRDLWATRGRVLFMVLALAAGLTSFGAVLVARTVVQREMNRAYVDSVPASATFDVAPGAIDDATLAAVRAHPDVAWAERRATYEARWRTRGGEWGRGLVFVIEDFEAQRLALLRHASGARTPPADGVLVERSAVTVLNRGGLATNEREAVVEISVGGASPRALRIVGVVNEPALAPASTEQAGYFYVTPEAFGAPLDELRVLVAKDPLDDDAVDRQVRTVAAWLDARGIAIHEVRVPPPGRHPHQAPSEAVLALFALFAALTVLLSAVLAASILSITMARQVREVAVMKTLGATGGEIRRLYAAMMFAVALGSLLFSIPAAVALGRVGVDAVANLLNFDVVAYAAPPWTYALQIAIGLVLPLAAALPAIRRASLVPVRDALDDHGAAAPRRIEGWFASFGDRLTRAALRNALRVPSRTALTVVLLGVGGALFVTALSVADSWNAVTDAIYEQRHYDLELHLTGPITEVVDAAGRVEAWGFAPVTLATADGLPLSRTYPDGGHGSFAMVAAPDDTTLVDFDMIDGRWLEPGDTNAVVLNQIAAARVGRDCVGREIQIAVGGVLAKWRVVGVTREIAAPAHAYVTQRAFAERAGGELTVLRVDAEPEAIASLKDRLASRGIAVKKAVPLELLYNAMGQHVVVLIRSLIALAMLMAIVGIVGLGSAISTSVVERTREIGVLQAVGARPAQVKRLIVSEAVAVTIASLPGALFLSVPLTAWVGRVIGRLSFELPLPLDLSWLAVAGWSIAVVTIAAVAALLPARGATRLDISRALTHV